MKTFLFLFLELISSKLSFCENTDKIASFAKAYGVVRHFYPYYEEDCLDWDNQLAEMIEKAFAANITPTAEIPISCWPFHNKLGWAFSSEKLIAVAPRINTPIFGFTMTGMKMQNIDGTDHHRIGVIPDIMVAPTIDGLRKGTDEVLGIAVSFLIESPNN